jgi:hypothetical protein
MQSLTAVIVQYPIVNKCMNEWKWVNVMFLSIQGKRRMRQNTAITDGQCLFYITWWTESEESFPWQQRESLDEPVVILRVCSLEDLTCSLSSWTSGFTFKISSWATVLVTTQDELERMDSWALC